MKRPLDRLDGDNVRAEVGEDLCGDRPVQKVIETDNLHAGEEIHDRPFERMRRRSVGRPTLEP